MTRTEHLIERLGHHGDGIAAGPVFAPLTLPGEQVSGVVERDRLGDLRILTPSVQRVKAPCAHFKSCGGCGLQHASDEFVAGWKVDVVRQALAAVGLEAGALPGRVGRADAPMRVAEVFTKSRRFSLGMADR